MAMRQGRQTRQSGIKDVGNGVYLVRVRATVNGKRLERERLVAAGSLTDALRVKLDLQASIVEETKGAGAPGASEAGSRLTLGALARAWLDNHRNVKRSDGTTRVTPNTLARYTQAVEKFIVPYLGTRLVSALTRHELEQWRDHLGAHYASATVNGLLAIVRMVLRWADCRVGDNVRALAEDDKRITDDEPNALDEDELARFIGAAAKLYPQHYALILVMLTSGQRISTVLALEWADVDRTAKVITFRRRISAGQVLPGLKRSRTERDRTPLLPFVEAALDGHRAQLSDVQLRSGLVFPSAQGTHHARTLLNVPFKRMLAEVSIRRRFTPHGARRTASALYRRAAGSAVAMAIVGHRTGEMHLHYSPVADDEKAVAAQTAFRLFTGEPDNKGGPEGGSKGARRESIG